MCYMRVKHRLTVLVAAAMGCACGKARASAARVVTVCVEHQDTRSAQTRKDFLFSVASTGGPQWPPAWPALGRARGADSLLCSSPLIAHLPRDRGLVLRDCQNPTPRVGGYYAQPLLNINSHQLFVAKNNDCQDFLLERSWYLHRVSNSIEAKSPNCRCKNSYYTMSLTCLSLVPGCSSFILPQNSLTFLWTSCGEEVMWLHDTPPLSSTYSDTLYNFWEMLERAKLHRSVNLVLFLWRQRSRNIVVRWAPYKRVSMREGLLKSPQSGSRSSDMQTLPM